MFRQHKHSNKPHLRIVVLKEKAPPISLYEGCSKMQEQSIKIPIHNNSGTKRTKQSIVYLSSIIQEENINQESSAFSDNSQRLCTEPARVAAASLDTLKQFRRLSIRECKRHLSAILETNSKEDQRYMRSQTENIESAIKERKVRPIDRLKIGKKNLHYSKENKVDLSSDFQQFVEKQSSSQRRESKSPSEKNTMCFEKRKRTKETVPFCSPIHQHTKIRSINSCITSEYLSIEIPGGKKRKQEKQQVGLIKRAKNGIPIPKNFRWSRLQNDSYNFDPK